MAEVKILDNFIFRKADIKDLKDIRRLDQELFKKEYREFDKSLDLNWEGREGGKYFKKRILSKNNFVEVVESGNKIIGYLCGGLSKGLYYRKKARYAELENMLIEEKFRGGGLGTKLAKDFIDWCVNKKIDYVNVSASAENKPSVGFYRSLGFKDCDLILRIKLS
ncbi:MAG: hypothetical protein A3A08_02620 [Candidatus Nealsonbacteria bacterium RIFCSPLOWO2_01_FULL_41_9]|uniref:N-acetyltransferase domain-containing protein n=1 Tax=Candidatus Nealsonbacteria bacterium RIFCSPLOWO2_01_FULL_41_9 TaxID=1801671 RepID=A0A1G2ECZ6_9BACT|nr:MAG: hypothetical protein A3A08_02620 [Candidatus Nealsonbacteria bacterium RIFCSPLOWO2_01_FULL_41_9]